MKKLKLWFKNAIKKIIKDILKDEYFIAADVHKEDTEIMVIKYSYSTGQFTILADHRKSKSPLLEVQRRIRYLVSQYSAISVCDVPFGRKF